MGGAAITGLPYFVMELVKGVPITKYCDEKHLTARERLELFLPVCHAVQHAHQKGIIHRDLKPSNVLVAQYDDRPVPKVIDFGVAKATSQKLTEKTMFTRYGQIVGTLEYMSPEQAQVNQLDVDTRSDIYSLGVLLYELLTGSTPFDKETLRTAAFEEMLRILREDEPPRPSTKLSSSDTLPSIASNRNTEPNKLSALLRGDIDWIVMKALEKDRTRRYETANGFAADIGRFLNDEPVEACPPSATYRFKKYAIRNKIEIATASAVAAALIIGTSIATWQAVKADKERDRAVQAEADVRVEQGKLEKALIRETSLRQSEQEQRQRADENVAIAHEAVNQFLKRIAEEDLMKLPGLQPIQRQLLLSALPFYEQFLADHAEDPKLRLELAEVYRQLGHLHSRLGDKTSWRMTSQKAYLMFEQLRQEDDKNHRVLSGIAWMNHMVLGRRDEAIGIYRDMLTRTPDDEQVLLELAITLHTKQNREKLPVEEKRRLLLEAELLVRKVLERNPDSERAPNKLTFILNSLGFEERRAGNHGQGLKYFEDAANQGLAALRRTPYAIKLGAVVAGACSSAAIVHASLGNAEQALVWREQQVVAARSSAFANPLVLET